MGSSVMAHSRMAARALQAPMRRARTSCRRPASAQAAAPETQREQVWRPSLDDVQRISCGDAARHRGTGSRAVPHRLNAEERKQYDMARQKGVLTLAGSGYRRERKGAPLANIWRQLCDARGQPCVLLAKGATAAVGDTVLVDLSVLRLADASQYREACRAIAAQHGCTRQAEASLQSPFTVILPPRLANALLQASASSAESADEPATEAPAAAGEAASSSWEPAAAAVEAEDEDSIAAQLAELRGSAPIWQHPPQLEGFTADRNTAKALAKQLAEELPQLGPGA